MEVLLINSMGTDKTIVDSARISHLKSDLAKDIEPKDEKLIKYLLDHGHTSPFEHVVLSFWIKCPIFVRNQLIRHRTFSFNEISRRYTSEQIDFWYPKELRKQDNLNKQGSVDRLDIAPSTELIKDIIQHTNHALNLYHKLLDSGVAREQARLVLPLNLNTQLYATVDLHNFIKFLKLRLDKHSQKEIRDLASLMLAEVESKNIIPITLKLLNLNNTEE